MKPRQTGGGGGQWLRHLEKRKAGQGGHRPEELSTFVADALAKDSQRLSSGFHIFLTLGLDAQPSSRPLHIGLLCSWPYLSRCCCRQG